MFATYTSAREWRGCQAKLEQGSGRTSPGFGALAAAQAAREIVHEGGRRVLHRREVDITWGLAPSALAPARENRH